MIFPLGAWEKEKIPPFSAMAIIWIFLPLAHCIVTWDYFLPDYLSANN